MAMVAVQGIYLRKHPTKFGQDLHENFFSVLLCCEQVNWKPLTHTHRNMCQWSPVRYRCHFITLLWIVWVL